jgi:ubiquinone/menaquinone biosynthesis C-methylase UbiE
MVVDSFIDPYTKGVLRRERNGDLYYRNLDVVHLYRNYDGICDFVQEDTELWKEKEHYDKEYSVGQFHGFREDLIRDSWDVNTLPWRKTLLNSLGDLRNKKILLVGNGESSKEFYFLMLGARVVFTDLSLEAVKHMRKKFVASDLFQRYCNDIEFHVIDALNLPFQDEEFDIIYGSAIVHHLEDLDKFFSEVYRCLKKDGICRFIDEANSPLWRLLKGTILHPFKMYSHWRQPRSPADLRAERKERYTYEKMAGLMKRHDFRDMVFLREWFLLRIVSRHYGKFFNYSPKAMRPAQKLFLAMKWLDTRLAHKKWMQRNQLMLIWGFNK